jgi:hypothetical protein
MTPEDEAEALVRLRQAYADHTAAKAAGTK